MEADLREVDRPHLCRPQSGDQRLFQIEAGKKVRIVAGSVNGGSALVVQPGDSTLKTAGRLPRQEDRDAAIRQHAGCRGARMAHRGRAQDHADRRRCAGGADRQSRSTAAVQAKADRRAYGRSNLGCRGSNNEAGGKILVDERDAITTVLVARAEVLATQRDLVRKFVAAHRELTEWIKANPDEAQRLAREELDAEITRQICAGIRRIAPGRGSY